MPTDSVAEALDHFAQLWQRERETTTKRFAEERRGLSLAARVEKGLALGDLEVSETDAAAGGRTLVWLALPASVDLDDLRVRNGDPVRLWWTDPDEDPVLGVAQRRGERLGVVLDGDPPDRLFVTRFALDRDAPQVTFERAERALAHFRGAAPGSAAGRLAEVFFGASAPELGPERPFTPFDVELSPEQRAAVRLALRADPVALIHGPPGTGKTRTLVEVVRQLVVRGERVLVSAASNVAVDNLAERLGAAGLRVVRLGHPARVSQAMESRTLDSLTHATTEWKLARRWVQESQQLRAKAQRRSDRGGADRRERRAAFDEARRLMKDARKQLAGAQRRILAGADVVCATAAGADSRLLDDLELDRVVLDEATQAVDPVALVALARAPRAVLAGDPRQLPPTVIDLVAAREGLSTTLFERLADRHPKAVQMLEVQHRMHEALMRFPSEQLYEGRLRAHPAVARRSLEDLDGVSSDPLRPGPWVFLDTAGTGWLESRAPDDPSTRNPEQAARVAAEVERLLRRGLAAREIAVITPYEAQARVLRHLLAAPRRDGLEVGTVDGFQGREKEAVVVDLVRANDSGELGFLSDIRRMNVALTRARRFLLVVGDSGTLGSHPFYAAFLDAAEATGASLSAFADDPSEPLPAM